MVTVLHSWLLDYYCSDLQYVHTGVYMCVILTILYNKSKPVTEDDRPP